MQNVEYFNYLGSMITNDARCNREIKIYDCHGKSIIQREEDSFQQQTRLQLKEVVTEVLHLECSFVWCWNLDTWECMSETPGKFWNVVLEKVGDQLGRSCEKLKVLQTAKEEKNILQTYETKEGKWNGHILLRNCLLNHVIERKKKIERTGRWGRRCRQLLDDFRKR
jgi:hypothetical protein